MTGFENEAHFFESYDSEQASSSLSPAPLEFDEVEAPSQEQLAHWARFRKPVGVFVSALALLPLVALGKRASQREFVAHYNAATPASATTATARARVARAPDVPAAVPSAVPSTLALTVSGFAPGLESAPSDVPPADIFAQLDSQRVAVCLLTPKSPISNR